MPEKGTENILGYSVTAEPLAAIVQSIGEWLVNADRTKSVMCANPHSLVIASRHSEFSQALYKADWLLPDGIGIVWASRLAGGHIRTRITGSDLFYELMQLLEDRGDLSCFFLGSTETTLSKIDQRLQNDFPHVTLAGCLSPPFKDDFENSETEIMVHTINAAKPDVLWVGMTAPKQEIFIHRILHKLDVPVVAAIGAVFDFYAGTTPRPGDFAQRFGIEWLGRLVREPRRLWRRTLVSGPQFGLLLLRHHLGSRSGPGFSDTI